jgi:hypothetical protein
MRYIIVAKPLTQPLENTTVNRASDRTSGIPNRSEGRSIVRPRITWGKGVFEKENCKLQIGHCKFQIE